MRDSSSVYAFNNPANLIKRPWKAAAEAFGINVLVNSFDRFVLNEDFAKISMNSIHENIKNGFVWDNDQFSTNLFAHPYHGGLYFNSARSNRRRYGRPSDRSDVGTGNHYHQDDYHNSFHKQDRNDH